jgi:stress response protein YsnF
LQGELIGYINDFSLDQNSRLYLVIPRASAYGFPVHLVSSKYIQKVDTANKAVFVDLSLAQLENLPLYKPSEDNMIEKSSMSSATSANISTSGEGQNLGNTQPPTDNSFTREKESFTDSEDKPEVVEEEIVRLLEERLIVNRSKRKVGDVVVRKEIETRIVEVPVHREKLIVEQVGSENKVLAEIDLGQGQVTGVELIKTATSEAKNRESLSSDHPYTVRGEFISPKAASNLLEAIALRGKHGCQNVRVELIVENAEIQEAYQQMFDRCSTR